MRGRKGRLSQARDGRHADDGGVSLKGAFTPLPELVRAVSTKYHTNALSFFYKGQSIRDTSLIFGKFKGQQLVNAKS